MSRAVSEFVDISGVRLFTRRIGTGPAVVVLHGGPGAHHDYLLPQYDLLARGRMLVYYDQRGGGQSPVGRDVPVGWREHVSDLEGLREHWNEERLTLLGYSWGGLLAVLYALHHPDRVARLALVCPAPLTHVWRVEFERRFAARAANPVIVHVRRELTESGLRERDPESYRREAFALSVAPYFRDPARARDLTPFRITQRTQESVWQSLGNYDLREDLRRVVASHTPWPSLTVAGVFDPMPLEGTRELASILQSRLVELPTGHAPHVEATGAMVEVLDRFLRPDGEAADTEAAEDEAADGKA